MASRWRIRHKLLLGVALVACVLALLLGGTLRGLWSYFQTTNAIWAKVQEGYAANKLEAAVSELAPRKPLDRYNKVQWELFHDAMKKARKELQGYSEQLDENMAHGGGQGVYERDQIEAIRKTLDALEEAIAAQEGKRTGEITGTGNQNDFDVAEKHAKALDGPYLAAQRATHDLQNEIKKSLDDNRGKTRSHYQMTLWIVVPSSVVGLLGMMILMRSFYSWVFTPIADLEKGVKSLAQGQFGHTINVNSGDEMQDLAVAFNEMSRRLGELYGDLANQVNERSRQLVRSERLASVGFLAAGVAHEINNPLASIAFCGEALEARLGDMMRQMRSTPRLAEEAEVFGKYLRMIQEEAFRCKSITERLLEFSRTGEPRREPTDLRDLVQAVLDVTQHLPNHKGKRIVFEVPPERAGRVSAWVNGEEIKSVVLNLVVNALESMEEDGTLTIRLGQRDGLAEIRFVDTGCGMSRETRENIFEPFFTRSRSGKGTGLGLTISHLIISQHAGSIEAQSAGVGLGSTFLVRLPTQPAGETAKQMTIGEPARLAA